MSEIIYNYDVSEFNLQYIKVTSNSSYYPLFLYEPEETNLFSLIVYLRLQWVFPPLFPPPTGPEIYGPRIELTSDLEFNLLFFYDPLESLLASSNFINEYDLSYNFAVDRYRNTGEEYYYFVTAPSEEFLLLYSLVIGTNIYADWSSIVGASIHSGILKFNQTKLIAIKSLPPQSTYHSSFSNGILSSDKSGGVAPTLGSFSVRSLFLNIKGNVLPELLLDELISYEYPVSGSEEGVVRLSLNSIFHSYILYVYDPFKVQIQNIPSNFVNFDLINFNKKFLIKVRGSTSGLLFGSNPYTIDSSIATAAVHSGAVGINKTGHCSIAIIPSQSNYPGSVQNGVPSFNATAEDDEFFGYNFSYYIYKNYISITSRIDNPTVINANAGLVLSLVSLRLSGSVGDPIDPAIISLVSLRLSGSVGDPIDPAIISLVSLRLSGSVGDPIDPANLYVEIESLSLNITSNVDYKFLIGLYKFYLQLHLNYNLDAIVTQSQQVEKVVLELTSSLNTLFKLSYKFSSLNVRFYNDLALGIDAGGLITIVYVPSGYLSRLSGRANVASVTNVVLKLSSEADYLTVLDKSFILFLGIVSPSTEYNRNRFMYNFIAKLKLGVKKRRGVDFGLQHGFVLDSNWVLGGTGLPDIALDFISEWSNLSGSYYWYRVLACYDYGEESLNSSANYYKSLKVQSNPSSHSKCNRVLDTVYDVSCGNNKPSLITGVVARNINEVCRILKRPSLGPNIYFKLLSIKKHKDLIGFGNGISSDLENVEFCNSPECLDFCIDYDLTNKFVNPCNYINFNMSVFSDILGSLFYHPKEKINNPIKISGHHVLFLIKLGNAIAEASVLRLKIGSSCDDTLYTEEGIAILSELGNKVLLEYSVCKNEIEFNNILVLFKAKLKLKSNSLFSCSSYNYITKSVVKIISKFELYLYSGYFYLFKFYETNSKIRAFSKFVYAVKFEYDCDNHRFFIDVSGNFNCILSRNFNYNTTVNLTCTPSYENYGIYLNVGDTMNYEPKDYSIKLKDLQTRVSSPYWSYDSSLEISLFKDISYIERCLTLDAPLRVSGGIGSVSYQYSINSFLQIGISSEIKEIYLDSIGLIKYAYPNEDSKLKVLSDSHLYYVDSSIPYKFIKSFNLMDSFLVDYEVSDISFENSISELSYKEITTNDFNINTCGCVSLSSVLSLSHTLLKKESPLTNFLVNNNIAFPSLLNLKYNKYNNSWISNNNIRSKLESWQLLFELSCLSDNEEPTDYLRFSFKASRNYANNSLKTFLFAVVDPRLACDSGNLTTVISFSENKKVYVDKNISDYYSYKDDIGMFVFSNFNEINCDGARRKKIGSGRRDGFAYCGGNGTFDFKINYPVAPVIQDKIRIGLPQQVIL